LPLKRAVYVAVAGPNLETAAEYRFLRSIGADTVGMSCVPECLAALHGGMKVLGLSVVTDSCFPDALEPADIEAIIQTANQAQPKLEALVTAFLKRLAGASS
jgi:purine-nucleoside phosphorylase